MSMNLMLLNYRRIEFLSFFFHITLHACSSKVSVPIQPFQMLKTLSISIKFFVFTQKMICSPFLIQTYFCGFKS